MAICAIVGVGPKLGAGLARAFAAGGHDLALFSRNPANMESLADELAGTGVQIARIGLDATNRTATQEAFATLKTDLGVPDVVIYNPANMVMAPFSEVSAEELEQTWPVMVYAAMNVTAAVLPAMLERGSGTLLFSGGGFGIDPSVTRAPHSIAKAALRNYAHGLHLELADKGVHAGTVTVHRPLQPGEDTEACAGKFVAMHAEAKGNWSWEQHYGR